MTVSPGRGAMLPMDFHPRGAGQEEGRARPEGDMLDVIGGPAPPAELRQQGLGLERRPR